MNDITLTKQQFENEAFKHWLRTGKMHNYDDYKNWVELEALKTKQRQFEEEYLNEELEDITLQEDVQQENTQQKKKETKKNNWNIPDWGDDEEDESERNYEEDEEEQKEGIKSGETKISDLMVEDSNFEIEEGKTYAVWSGGSCDGCQTRNGMIYEVGCAMMSADIPETHPNYKCELTMLDANMLPTKEKVPLKKWEEDQNKPKPVAKMDLTNVTFPNEYTEGRKLGNKSENKKWSDMTEAEREAEKIKQLEKFIKSKKLEKNIEEAQKMKNKSRPEKWKWMYDNFKTGDKYDIKHGKPAMEHAGNFNYGVMGRAAGLSEFELKRGAGFYQKYGEALAMLCMVMYPIILLVVRGKKILVIH